MNRKTYFIFFILALLFVSRAVVHSETKQEEKKAKNISKTVLIDIIAEVKTDGVVLEHSKHVNEYEIGCVDCHHMYDETIEEAPSPCVNCHDFNEHKVIEGIRTPLIKTSVMRNIYHDICRDCHDKLQRSGKPFPKKCSVCHPLRIE